MSSHTFRSSRALVKLLRYVCAKAIVDGPEHITEYTIGVDVFGKPETFKENNDARVRVELHRLRRRLDLFYKEEGSSDDVRIVIPAGRYTPQFFLSDHMLEPNSGPSDGSDRAVIMPVVPPMPVTPLRAAPLPDQEAVKLFPPAIVKRRRLWSRAAVIACFGLVLVATLIALRISRWTGDPLTTFWRPVVSSPVPILLCVGNLEGGYGAIPGSDRKDGLTLSDFHRISSEMVLLGDATALSKVAGLLESKGKQYRVLSQSDATFTDLQNSPAVLIGLMNNEWTERLVGKLRFVPDRLSPDTVMIRDRADPRHNWSLTYSTPYLSVTKDYALVLRVYDSKTEQMTITAAGISVFGTLAAAEFLTSPDEMRKLAAVAPKDWLHKNIEVVLSTDVIRGKPGHPNVIATHFW